MEAVLNQEGRFNELGVKKVYKYTLRIGIFIVRNTESGSVLRFAPRLCPRSISGDPYESLHILLHLQHKKLNTMAVFANLGTRP